MKQREVVRNAKVLLSQLTLPEKLGQLGSGAPAIERLGLKAEPMGSECIHGVGRAGRATLFPQSLGLASTRNLDLMTRVATAISDELRAKYHEAERQGPPFRSVGLTVWSPNINLFRDPRWGRGQETYGEDPYLTARFGVAFIRAMQGDDPRFLKTACAVKHFAVHSGPDAIRHQFDIHVSEKDLRETYLPHFEAAIREARAVGVMGAYNRLNGEHCCASPTLLQGILRDEWGFDGFVVSDGGALHDLHDGHRLTQDEAESAALALRHGCDYCLGHEHRQLPEAHQRGLVSEADVDRSVERLLATRLRLGVLDPQSPAPYASIPISVVDCPEHRALARQAAAESIVLFKNANNTLPLRKDLRSITVAGPNASDVEALLGNYNGFSARMVTPLEGITAAVSPLTRIQYVRGCDVTGANRGMIRMAANYGNQADAIVAVLGLSPIVEGEDLRVGATVTNTGASAGAEVVQLYLSHVQAPFTTPLRQLAGFRRVQLAAGESTTVKFDLPAEQLRVVNLAGKPEFVAGEMVISIGGSQPDALSWRLMGRDGMEGSVIFRYT